MTAVLNRYLLAMIAGIWMADGLALLAAPRYVMGHLRDVVGHTPHLMSWEGLTAALGVCLLVGTRGLSYEWLWTMTGLIMIFKGLFFMMGSSRLRERVLAWALGRDDIDYRFWGLGLCTLSILLLHASGWIGAN